MSGCGSRLILRHFGLRFRHFGLLFDQCGCGRERIRGRNCGVAHGPRTEVLASLGDVTTARASAGSGFEAFVTRFAVHLATAVEGSAKAVPFGAHRSIETSGLARSAPERGRAAICAASRPNPVGVEPSAAVEHARRFGGKLPPVGWRPMERTVETS